MPIVDKTAFTQFTSTGCERQLRIAMHPDDARHLQERADINLPHRQIRPALAEITAAGNEWGQAKVFELNQAFGSDLLVGGNRRIVQHPTNPGLVFDTSELLAHLQTRVAAGVFLVETEFDADTPTFRTVHNLDQVLLEGKPTQLEFARLRPDLIEVLPPAEIRKELALDGEVIDSTVGDDRPGLRIIDVKLTSEPGPHYFSELAYYSLALAAWLVDHHLDSHYRVCADPAVWPGSEKDSNLQQAISSNMRAPYEMFHEDLVTAPLRIFMVETRRVLRTIIPRVLDTPYAELPWAVTHSCQGCENLGQKFKPTSGTKATDWDERHCLPTAELTQDLSRLPFLSRGAIRVLRENGTADVPAVAALDPASEAFTAHHRLSGQRNIVGRRARALTGEQVSPIGQGAFTTGIPAGPKLRIYVTADFDPGSAITLAFGLGRSWLSRDQIEAVPTPRVQFVATKTPEAEWAALSLFLDELDSILTQAQTQDPLATVQVYVWDTITFDHLTRVIGRHLAHILATGRLKRLAWMFPPEQVVASPRMTQSPAVSIVHDAARSLLSLDMAHTYTLLEVARRYHRDNHPYPDFRVPRYWHDPFSNQIPPERAHQLWRGRQTPSAPTSVQSMSDLNSTVRTKVFALEAVVEKLTADLVGYLPRRAPEIRSLSSPQDVSGSSHLGLLLYVHAKLNAALQELEVSRNRALAVEERESKFVAARLTRRLVGAEATGALATLEIPNGPHREVFELAETSRDVQASDGDFSWAIFPGNQTHHLDWSVASLIYRTGDADLEAQFGNNYTVKSLKLAKVFGTTIIRIDRDRRLLVVDFEHWDSDVPLLRSAIVDGGYAHLDTNLVMDKVAADFFTRRVLDAINAIKNPPSAAGEPRIQQAIGITRTPRRGTRVAIEDFIWRADVTSTETTDRDAMALRQAIESRHHLNESQWVAWERAMSRRLSLIWGPPGTGKTHTVRAIIAALAEHGRDGKRLRIAVTSTTYNGFDTVLRGLVDELAEHYPDAAVRRLRSGSRSVPEWLPADGDVEVADDEAMNRLTARLNSGTTTIVASTAEQLQRLIKRKTNDYAGDVFDVIIVDEAGQMDVAHALVALAGAAEHATVIIAGDPMQLPPIHQAGAPVGLESLVGSIYDFYRVWWQIPDSPLLVNYRSNAEIVDVGRRAGYPDELVAFAPERRISYSAAGKELARARTKPTNWPQDLPFVEELIDIADPAQPVVCLTYPEGVSGQWNQFEVDTVASLVFWYATTVGMTTDAPAESSDDRPSGEKFWTEMVGIVTPHRAQRSRVVQRLIGVFCTPGSDERTPEWIAAAVDTVERFQGQERDIIFATYAVGDPDSIAEEDEFLHDIHRFNVLATRAKAKLVVVVSREIVDHISHDLEVITSSAMLKDFVDFYCNWSVPTRLTWNDKGIERAVVVEARTRQ